MRELPIGYAQLCDKEVGGVLIVLLELLGEQKSPIPSMNIVAGLNHSHMEDCKIYYKMSDGKPINRKTRYLERSFAFEYLTN